jgi:hypothetical protein
MRLFFIYSTHQTPDFSGQFSEILTGLSLRKKRPRKSKQFEIFKKLFDGNSKEWIKLVYYVLLESSFSHDFQTL